MLSNLVKGTYQFTLTCTNSNNVNNSDTVTLTVNEGILLCSIVVPSPSIHLDVNELYIVQLYVEAEIANFTKDDLV